MNEAGVNEAATILWNAWLAGGRMSALPDACRPRTLDEGYAVQRAMAKASGEKLIGWKIAASSENGQRHIGVDGPLVGRLYARFADEGTTTLDLARCGMRLAEVEFTFRMARDLPPRAAPYSSFEVMSAVASLHPALEFPDTRFDEVTKVGPGQIAADTACAWRFVYGPAMPDHWRSVDLSKHEVDLVADGTVIAKGVGGNALGDPRKALTWLANELSRQGETLRAGELVTTGTCIVPAPLKPGQTITARYGELGELTVKFAG